MLRGALVAILAAGMAPVFSMVAAQPADPPRPIRISMAKSFFHDQPEVVVKIAADEFKEVMRTVTGLKGEVAVHFTAAQNADKINAKELDFAILYAHEFAWAKKKHPELRPLLIAATKQHDKRAHLIVNKACPAKSVADLRGKKLDLPSGTKEYCRIYVDKLCPAKDGGPSKIFGAIVKSASQVDALDAVARKDAEATVIDTIWLDYYKEIKGPVFAKNLTILQQSAIVPPAVVVYKPGALPDATMQRIRAGLLKAHTSTRGQVLMALWHIDAFAAVPKDYDKSLADVVKDYPAPAPMP